MKCQICGKEIEKSGYSEGTLCSSSECFRDWFWQKKIELMKTHPGELICCGKDLYWLGDETSKEEHGFGGSKFKIVHFDDTVQYSTNLWSNGSIPDKYLPQFESIRVQSVTRL